MLAELITNAPTSALPYMPPHRSVYLVVNMPPLQALHPETFVTNYLRPPSSCTLHHASIRCASGVSISGNLWKVVNFHPSQLPRELAISRVPVNGNSKYTTTATTGMTMTAAAAHVSAHLCLCLLTGVAATALKKDFCNSLRDCLIAVVI